MRVATIDVGTNSILLLILDDEVEGGGRVLADRCRIERLGQGVDRTGSLDGAAVARALDALREYAEIIRENRVDRVAAIGTQALREVDNGAAFLDPAAEILGRPVEVVGGLREAELGFAAVMASFPEHRQGPVLVCDVGGGSTELILGRDGRIETLVSLPIGSVRMAERHLKSNPPTAAEAAAMIGDLDRAIGRSELPNDLGPTPIVGLAGTVTTLAAVSLGLEPYDPDRVQGMRLSRAEIERQLGLYLTLPLATRRQIRGLDPRRADVIAGGAAVVARILARFAPAQAGPLGPSVEMLVSDRGIRWGLAFELIQSK